jgi:hypothetical protein
MDGWAELQRLATFHPGRVSSLAAIDVWLNFRQRHVATTVNVA